MASAPERRPAAFLDRDGTIIRDTGYISEPDSVEVLPGAAEAIARLNRAGVPVIVVTNQSGIARGYFTMQHYEGVRDRLDDMLSASGARIDATYFCPHHPDVTGPCECRKPGLLLFHQAAADHQIDLTRSTWIGDRWRDIAPSAVSGGRGILVTSSMTPPEDLAKARAEAEVAASLGDAVQRILGGDATIR